MATDPITIDFGVQKNVLKHGLEAPPTNLAPGSSVDVRITGTSGQVNIDYVLLSKTGRQEIVWHNDTSGQVVVSFARREPFEDALFVIAAGEYVRSKPAREAAIENKAYKYSVSGVDGTNDPTIIIQK